MPVAAVGLTKVGHEQLLKSEKEIDLEKKEERKDGIILQAANKETTGLLQLSNQQQHESRTYSMLVLVMLRNICVVLFLFLLLTFKVWSVFVLILH